MARKAHRQKRHKTNDHEVSADRYRNPGQAPRPENHTSPNNESLLDAELPSMLIPTRRPSIRSSECVFDGHSDVELKSAYAYYYQHPNEIPDRISQPMQMADEPPMRIKVHFDQGIWKRASSNRGLGSRNAQTIESVAPNEVVSEGVDD